MKNSLDQPILFENEDGFHQLLLGLKSCRLTISFVFNYNGDYHSKDNRDNCHLA